MDTPASGRPNIVFIMTDQQRFDALSRHGGIARTPRLDALAAGGADLRKHFSQAPVCVPSRCSLFTGRYPHTTRVQENASSLSPTHTHLFKILKTAGYQISYLGKNHLLDHDNFAANADRFDTFEAPSADPTRRAYQELERESLGRLASIGSYASSAYHDFPDDATTTGQIANAAVEAIRAAPADRPWSVTASFFDPHVPHLAPRRFEPMYPLESIQLPRYETDPLVGKAPRAAVKREAQGALRATDEERRFYSAVYASMCSFVDEQVGRILDALEDRGDAENTIVVFTSDHGDFNWDYGLCKKDLLLYDSLLHVPAILHWPGRIAPQTVSETFTEHVDFVPTLLDLAGLPEPKGVQGKSMVPLLEGRAREHRSSAHAEICYADMRNPFATYDEFRDAWTGARERGEPLGNSAPYNVPGDYVKSLRTLDWTYIWYGDGFEELYDARRDPRELVNLAATRREETAELRKDLKLQLFEWLAQTADPLSPSDEIRQSRQTYAAWQIP